MQRTDEQTAFARRLRRKQTFAERILWILLRDRDLAGYKVVRFTDALVHGTPDRVASDILSVLVSSKIKQPECV